jgi:hypothetical protein
MTAKRSSPAKEWSVLVYFGGDNDLSEEMVWALQEMRKAASLAAVADAMNVVALFDPRGENPKRYEIVTPDLRPRGAADGGLEASSRPHASGRKESVSGTVGRFLTTVARDLPRTKHYAIVLSGHGSGAVGDFLVDAEPASTLSIPGLRGILERTRAATGAKIDLVGMDSCQMSTIEVGFEIRESARYLVASEGLVLNAGWPYHRVLEALAEDDSSSVPDRARAVAARYLSFYRDYEVAGLSTDVGVTDLSRIEPLADRVRELAEALSTILERLAADGLEEAFELGELERSVPDPGAEGARSVRDALLLAHWSAQSYKCDRYVDLHDFCEQLLRFGRGFTGDEALRVRAAADGVREAVSEAVIASGTTGAEFQHSRGLSIYFPWSSRDYASEYRNLDFARHTKWADFLETYLRVTPRMRRFQGTRVTEAASGPGVARDRNGRDVVPAPPRRRPRSSLVSGRDVEAGTHRDVESGTHRDVEAGTHRGKGCPSTMKSPPEGYYDGSELWPSGKLPTS